MLLEEVVWYRVTYIKDGELLGYSDQFENVEVARKL